MRALVSSAVVLLTGCGGIRICEAPPVELSKLECLRPYGGGTTEAIGIQYIYAREQSPEASDDFGCFWEVDATENTLKLVPTGYVCAFPNQGLDPDRAWVTRRCKRPPNGVWQTSHGTRAMRVTVTNADITCELL